MPKADQKNTGTDPNHEPAPEYSFDGDVPHQELSIGVKPSKPLESLEIASFPLHLQEAFSKITDKGSE